MIINNNIPALNTHRQMGMNQNNMQESMEKLSSGLRINNASDDAAGLAISEKMRGQINGLEQASNNAQDGISMIQTAEGALNESHSILQRMRELGTQAANDTNVDVDRDEIQKEMNSLTSELNRIGNATEFNTQSLLNGGEEAADLTASTAGTGEVALTGAVDEVQGETTFSVDTALEAGDSVTIGGVTVSAASGGDIDTDSVTDVSDQAAAIKTTLESDGAFSEQYSVTDNNDGSLTIKEKEGQASGSALSVDDSGIDTAGGSLAGISDNVETVSTKESDPELTIDTAFEAGDTLTVGEKTYTFGNNSEDFDVDVSTGNAESAGAQADALASLIAEQSGVESAVSDNATSTIAIEQGGGEGFSASFQIGANQGQSLSVEINDMRANALGVSGEKAGGEVEGVDGAKYTEIQNVTDGTNSENSEYALDVSSHESAAAAVTTINNAIEQVSSERSSLGASQNRLEHTISNLDNSAENLQSAESRIRDVDMAAEMMEQTKASVLAQASQSMLAQANQQPQQVLQLLQ